MIFSSVEIGSNKISLNSVNGKLLIGPGKGKYVLLSIGFSFFSSDKNTDETFSISNESIKKFVVIFVSSANRKLPINIFALDNQFLFIKYKY